MPIILTLTCYFLLTISLLFLMYRIVKGPHILDRVMCLDGVGLVVVSLIAIINITLNTRMFFDVILVIAIIGFISTVALTKYLESGDIIQ